MTSALGRNSKRPHSPQRVSPAAPGYKLNGAKVTPDCWYSQNNRYRSVLPTTSRSGTVYVQNLSINVAGMYEVKNSVDNVFDRSLFHFRLHPCVVGVIAVHGCIHHAGS